MSVTKKNGGGVELGPIGMTLQSGDEGADGGDDNRSTGTRKDWGDETPSIARLTTAEWRAKYEDPDGRVDLMVEEDFNAGSRLVGGREVHLGVAAAGTGTGEGPSVSDAPRHTCTIKNMYNGEIVVVDVPQDRYILWEAEDAGLVLPYACRAGCCTACAVKVTKGEVFQHQALGVSKELRDAGYALMCVAFPLSDCEMETCEEDLLYQKQFGRHFEQYALDKDGALVERDDFALEIADFDE